MGVAGSALLGVSQLLTAVLALAEGAGLTKYLRATIVALIVTTGLLTLSMRGLERRDCDAEATEPRRGSSMA